MPEKPIKAAKTVDKYQDYQLILADATADLRTITNRIKSDENYQLTQDEMKLAVLSMAASLMAIQLMMTTELDNRAVKYLLGRQI